MKIVFRIIKIILVVVIAAVALFVTLGVLLDKGVLKTTEDKPEITINYNDQNIGKPIDEDAIEDSHFFTSFEDALKKHCPKEDDARYQNKIDQLIKRFESDKYVTLYYTSKKNDTVECLTMAKFLKKEINGEEKYAFLTCTLSEITANGKRLKGSKGAEELTYHQVALSDFLQDMNVNPESTRFVFGDCTSKYIYRLKIEGQKPTEIISYNTCQGKRYFWYYENIDSTRPADSLEITFK